MISKVGSNKKALRLFIVLLLFSGLFCPIEAEFKIRNPYNNVEVY